MSKTDKTTPNQSDDSETDTFDTIREELRHWPYTIHQIHDTLDLSLIEGRAKQLLFQSLNTKNITAFVGSGISAAYGRMGWSTWQNAQISTTKKLTDSLLALTKASDERATLLIKLLTAHLESNTTKNHPTIAPTIRWMKHRLRRIKYVGEELAKLQSTFNLAQHSNGDFPGGDSLPIKFEIAQKLHDLVIRNRDLFLPKDIKSESAKKQQLLDKNSIEEIKMTEFWGIRPDTESGALKSGLNDTKKIYFDHANTLAKVLVNPDDISSYHHSFKAMQTCMQRYLEISKRPEGKMTFENLAKTLLVDECAHAEEILITGLSSKPEDGRETPFEKHQIEQLRNELGVISLKNCKRHIDGIRQNPERFKVMQYFRISQLREFLNDTSSALPGNHERNKLWLSFFDSLKKVYDDYADKTNHQRIFLTPTSRFIIQVLLKLSPDPAITLNKLLDGNPLDSKDYTSRRSIIANRFDPLDRTIRHLNIHRYLTTNYDFEIERFYQDIGFREKEVRDSTIQNDNPNDRRYYFDRGDYRVDGIGTALWDTCFDPTRASDLVTFATDTAGSAASVFHLHGRATLDDPLVITERNYMEMYIKTDERREMINEGITMAFSASHILFIGLGMEEADVLRPLRQFISDNDQTRGYTAMVLLPADKSIEARSKFASALYLRYGTHTIFYGSGEIKLVNPGDYPPRIAIDWLHRVTRLIEALRNSIKHDRDEINIKIANYSGSLSSATTLKDIGIDIFEPTERLKNISDHVGKFGADLTQDEFSQVKDVLPILFGELNEEELLHCVRSQNFKDFPTLKSPIFTTQRPRNMSMARRHRMGVDSTDLDGTEFLEFYLNLLRNLLIISLTQPDNATKLYAFQREISAHQSALDGLQGALLTATLCASLTSLSTEWRVWWRHWQQRPPHRNPVLELRRNGVQAAGQPLLPKRFIRYRVVNSISDMQEAEDTLCPEFNTESGMPDVKTHIRAFDTFVEALASQPRSPLSEHAINSRRFYTIAADTGLGKGTFFSMLSTRLGLSSYLRAAHPSWVSSANSTKRTLFTSSIFLNFSYSTEIASTYDMSLNVIKKDVSTLYGIIWLVAEILKSPRQSELAKIIDINFDDIYSNHALSKSTEKTITALLQQAETWQETIPRIITAETKKSDLTNRPDQLLFEAIGNRSTITLDFLHHQYRDSGRGDFLQATTEKFGELSKLFSDITEEFFQTIDNSKSGDVLKPIVPRFLLCLNGCELFFEHGENSKNLEVADFLSFLASRAMSKVPIDIITIGSEKRLGLPWLDSAHLTKNTRKQYNKYRSDLRNQIMVRENCNARAKSLVKRRARYSSINFGEKPIFNTKGLSDDSIHQTNLVHFTRIMDPTRLLVDNFLPLAAILHAYRLYKKKSTAETDPHLFRRHYHQYQNSLHTIWSTEDIVNIEDLTVEKRQHFLHSIHGAIADIDPQIPASLDELRVFIVENYRTQHVADLNQWKELRATFSSNRFVITLLLAAAQEIALSEDSWVLGAQKAESFMSNTANRVRNVSNHLAEETVIQAVLDVYRLYHKIGDPVYDIELHYHLLRNIAVINSPIGSNVVARLPSVRNYLNSVTAAENVTLGRRRMVAKALFSLGERGLVFHITPHSDLIASNELVTTQASEDIPENRDTPNDSWPQSHNVRYSLHRMIQQYCVSKLGSTAYEPVRVNSFAPSLYASMPSGVPRLSHEAYRYLRAVMVSLSQYPDIPHTNTQDAVWLYSTQDRVTKIQSLRAAMSMVRSTFSIAVVSRFEEYKSIPGENKQRSRGYFETYKVRLRWIIRKAWELYVPEHDADNNIIEIGALPDPTHDGLRRTNALYRDEIVWLYNEVGITSLVQGNLREAIAHLRQALSLCEKIEGIGGGRQHSMISLNMAIAQIERGRLSKADARLKIICRREKAFESRIYYLATGYRGLTMHLMGRRKKAQKNLAKAVKYFENKNEDRATAIFKNHLARLVPDRNIQKSKKELRSAIEHAEAGGHEDIRHHILISQVRISQFNEKDPYKRLVRDRLVVQDVREYARVMGIPSLTCDSLHAEAQILLANGDSHSSGKLLVRAMAIARRNDLKLRLSSMLTAYARVLLQRGSTEAARRLLISSLEISKKYEYALQVDRTLRVLEDEKFGTARVT